ncbi:MAG: hypothetical protein IKE30_11120 [Clostridia bacterium]|nr:hypothetical protein [Clostridia bacterium]
MTDNLTGLPLETALRLAGSAAEDARVLETRPPRHPRETGTLRVLRRTGGTWLVARFPDSPQEDPS